MLSTPKTRSIWVFYNRAVILQCETKGTDRIMADGTCVTICPPTDSAAEGTVVNITIGLIYWRFLQWGPLGDSGHCCNNGHDAHNFTDFMDALFLANWTPYALFLAH